MPLADQAMSGQALSFQKRPSQISVADVGKVSGAAQFWRFRHEDADIVQHGRFLEKIQIQIPALEAAGDCNGFLRHQPAV